MSTITRRLSTWLDRIADPPPTRVTAFSYIAQIETLHDQRVDHEYDLYQRVGGIEQSRRYWVEQGTDSTDWFKIARVDASVNGVTMIWAHNEDHPQHPRLLWSGDGDYEEVVRAFLRITYPVPPQTID